MPTIQRIFKNLILAVVRLLLVTLFTFYLQELRQEQQQQQPERHIRRDEIDNLHPSDADDDSGIDS